MPIIFISLNKDFVDKLIKIGIRKEYIKLCKIEDYIPRDSAKRTYYVSPANSLCFMNGGIDLILSRIIFPNIEKEVKRLVRKYGKKSKLDRYYLPIGSSIICDISNNNMCNKICDKQCSLIISPTMLLPQNVANTNNAYYCTMAVLYNIFMNRKEKFEDVDILITSLCCGYGKMNVDESIKQIIQGIRDYKKYTPEIINNSIVLAEPNLDEQPNYYMNTEWKDIPIDEIVNV